MKNNNNQNYNKKTITLASFESKGKAIACPHPVSQQGYQQEPLQQKQQQQQITLTLLESTGKTTGSPGLVCQPEPQ